MDFVRVKKEGRDWLAILFFGAFLFELWFNGFLWVFSLVFLGFGQHRFGKTGKEAGGVLCWGCRVYLLKKNRKESTKGVPKMMWCLSFCPIVLPSIVGFSQPTLFSASLVKQGCPLWPKVHVFNQPSSSKTLQPRSVQIWVRSTWRKKFTFWPSMHNELKIPRKQIVPK